MEIFDYDDELSEVRNFSLQFQLRDILRNEISSAFRRELHRVLLLLRDNLFPTLGIHLPVQICSDLQVDGIDDVWLSIKNFTSSEFSPLLYMEYYFFELVIYVYDPVPNLVHIERDVVKRHLSIVPDKEGLIDGKYSAFILKKEGLLFGNKYLFFNKSLPGTFVSHGFVADLLSLISQFGDDFDQVGISLHWHLLLDKKYYRESITKAYIRGPIGLSEDMLSSPSFPQDSSGTVTEHRRTKIDPLLDLTYPLDRLEVMWKERDSLKSVQIEELKPLQKREQGARCKYVHSQWSSDISKIVHFDAAICNYSSPEYGSRFNTDLKKYKGKAEDYEKLFKINGKIPLKEWCNLVTKFYDPNELVGEYFGGYQDEPTNCAGIITQ